MASEQIFTVRGAVYRGHLAGVLARRAVALANGPATGVMMLLHGSPPASGWGADEPEPMVSHT